MLKRCQNAPNPVPNRPTHKSWGIAAVQPFKPTVAAHKHHPFAPGVIDGPAEGSSNGWVAEAIAVVIALGAICAVAGFATGYIRIPGWLI